jgi:hypothetical protein
MVSYIKVLYKHLSSERKEVAGDCRSLRNEKLHNLYASTDITTVIKSRKVRWAKHVVRIGEIKKESKQNCGRKT